MTHQHWTFDWLTTWDDVWSGDFITEWQRWLEHSPSAHVFFHPTLVRAWVETYLRLQDIQPRFLIARYESEATFFMPLVRLRSNWKNARLRSLVPVGYTEFDYHDPIANGPMASSLWPSFWQAFQEEVSQTWAGDVDLISIGGIREPYASPEQTETDACPYIDISQFGSEETLLQNLSGKLRGDLRRQQRRLGEWGHLEYHVFHADETEAALASLSFMLAEHALRWPQSYRAPSFHERLVRDGLGTGIAHFSELRLNGYPISWHLGFLYGNRFYWYLPVYRPELSSYSPGKVHLYFCVVEAMKREASIFDLLRGDEEYKKRWTDTSVPLFEYRWHAPSALASLRRGWVERVKPRMKRLRIAKSGV